MSDETLKIQALNESAYRLIRQMLDTNKVAYYTHQLKSERPYRVVIQGLHPQTDKSEIISSLQEHNHEVREVTNVIIKKLKDPSNKNGEKIAVTLPLFFVSLEPKENNKQIFDIQALLYQRITVEAPHRRKDVPQCKNCQQFGHTRAYCKKSPKCVKCGDNHQTAACIKTKKTKPKCANCAENHTANWKGCEAYRTAQQKCSPKITTVIDRLREDTSFADVAKQNSSSSNNRSKSVEPAQPEPSSNQNNVILQLLQNIQLSLQKMEFRLQRLEGTQKINSR